MRIIKGLLLFYKRLLIPLVIISVTLNLMGMAITGKFSLHGLGITYIFLSPLLQYFIYEIIYPEEYYFYYNLGLSKTILWFSTLLIGYVIGLTMILL